MGNCKACFFFGEKYDIISWNYEEGAAEVEKRAQENKKQQETGKKKKDIVSIILCVAGVALITLALAMLVPNLLNYKKSNDTYEALNEAYVSEGQTDEAAEQQEADSEVKEETDWKDVVIDFDRLKQLNPDIIGWIRFDHVEQLSYPILYSGDDSTYLRTDIYGNSTIAGCIFLEGMNAPDFNDRHTIVYGHNMKNQSMFGSLKKYKTEDFYEGNQYFTVYTEDKILRYQIFSYRDVPETDSVYTVGFGADDAFQTFIDEMVRKSYYDTGIKVTKEDYVMTLSTCSTTGNRFVVHAVRVGEYDREE